MHNKYPQIITIVTNTPPTKYLQMDLLQMLPSNKAIHDIYNNSNILSRQLATLEFFENANTNTNTLSKRFEQYKEIALPLAVNIAKDAICKANLTNLDIHKIIFVSSTGIFAPFMDVEIIKQLKLPNTIERNNVFFMGCAAAITGIKIANDYLKSNTDKNVLLIALELSSVHANLQEMDINNIVTHCIFSDGIAAVVMSSCKKPTISIIDSFSYLIPDTEDGIILSVNEESVSCTLSKNLPTYINKNIKFALQTFLNSHNLSLQNIDFWCVHPGGKKIIDSVQEGLELTNEQVTSSREILRNYGNMLSCSTLFVLEKFAKLETKEEMYCVAFSFSPGVGVEFLLLKKHV